MASRATFDIICGFIIDEIKRKELGLEGQALIGAVEKSKDNVFNNYSDILEYIKHNYMKNPDGLIDRHKCAAAYMIAFLNHLEIAEEMLKKEFFAIFAGLLILKLIIREENKNFCDCGIVNFINGNGDKFKFPDCIRDNGGPYEYNWALGIHYDRMGGRLSALSLANTLFFIERHNRTLAEIEMLKRQDKSGV